MGILLINLIGLLLLRGLMGMSLRNLIGLLFISYKNYFKPMRFNVHIAYKPHRSFVIIGLMGKPPGNLIGLLY
ncbi:hypothetical protein OC25_13595 [Pedobacter kyungheensis]|uniref:Uncharacterized protein n=1 Tax=Pedobacter kyungheensis TaxID=1069985 RepID=A0A0C1FKL0_9SPHI|nr:hypothetical protein OC25_13595 [Pedobacter kyungheensis]